MLLNVLRHLLAKAYRETKDCSEIIWVSTETFALRKLLHLRVFVESPDLSFYNKINCIWKFSSNAFLVDFSIYLLLFLFFLWFKDAFSSSFHFNVPFLSRKCMSSCQQYIKPARAITHYKIWKHSPDPFVNHFDQGVWNAVTSPSCENIIFTVFLL